MSPAEAVELVAAGFVIGVYATAIGAGGGFLITPLLLARYPGADPALVTTASLVVVAVGSAVSSALITREDRVDRRLVMAMATVAVPAGLLGALGTAALPRHLFAFGFAVLLALLAVYLFYKPTAGLVEPHRRGSWRRNLVDHTGTTFSYRVPVVRSIVPTVGTSFLAALAGIGGGPIGVPLMTRIMHVPHAVAVPSMHLLIAVQALTVVAFHLALGHGGAPLVDTPWLCLGVVVANPLGHRLRRTLGEGMLTRALAIGLLIVAAQTAWTAL